MEGKTYFSRRLKQFDGLTWLTLTRILGYCRSTPAHMNNSCEVRSLSTPLLSSTLRAFNPMKIKFGKFNRINKLIITEWNVSVRCEESALSPRLVNCSLLNLLPYVGTLTLRKSKKSATMMPTLSDLQMRILTDEVWHSNVFECERTLSFHFKLI